MSGNVRLATITLVCANQAIVKTQTNVKYSFDYIDRSVWGEPNAPEVGESVIIEETTRTKTGMRATKVRYPKLKDAI